MKPETKTELLNVNMDNISNIIYNNGITVGEGMSFMYTHVEIINGKHIMDIFTYLSRNEALYLSNNNDKSILLGKDCYDSFEEAIDQAHNAKVDIKDTIFTLIRVNMSYTVFDKLSTCDIKKLKDFYILHEQDINSAFQLNKDKRIKNIDDEAIMLYKQNCSSNIGIIRDIQKTKSSKSSLKCISSSYIIKYNIIDTNIIHQYSFNSI